ncbi:hypothetical protein GE061_001699 [Apolygus lucorum]|uniref:Uncharacterized protein n=1 Tax=Apolygus lucorum TaxID=248454 RepID=A0A8S9YG79_APOLU|nr:hypothetical protein GE061_001699 [Apolygus lucorum]
MEAPLLPKTRGTLSSRAHRVGFQFDSSHATCGSQAINHHLPQWKKLIFFLNFKNHTYLPDQERSTDVEDRPREDTLTHYAHFEPPEVPSFFDWRQHLPTGRSPADVTFYSMSI